MGVLQGANPVLLGKGSLAHCGVFHLKLCGFCELCRLGGGLMLREVNSINKGDFPPLLFHFQRGPGPDMAEAVYCGSRAGTTAAGAGVICRLWLHFYRAAVSWRIKHRYRECELWVLINLVTLCGLGKAGVFPFYDLRVHFLQPVEQLANLWNGYPVNAACPWRDTAAGSCRRGRPSGGTPNCCSCG